ILEGPTMPARMAAALPLRSILTMLGLLSLSVTSGCSHEQYSAQEDLNQRILAAGNLEPRNVPTPALNIAPTIAIPAFVRNIHPSTEPARIPIHPRRSAELSLFPQELPGKAKPALVGAAGSEPISPSGVIPAALDVDKINFEGAQSLTLP